MKPKYVSKILQLKKPAQKILLVRNHSNQTEMKAWLASETGRHVVGNLLAPNAHEKAMAELLGKPVFFAYEGARVAGKALRIEGANVIAQMAIPGRDGRLYLTEATTAVKQTDLELGKALISGQQIKIFEASAALTLPADCKAKPIRMPRPMAPKTAADGTSMVDAGAADDADCPICDYQDVVIEGFASTFVSTTPKDRGGDYILPGAFDATIPEFMTNPVILTDHENEVDAIAGSWEKVGVTAQGLAVRGRISNAPGMCDVRYKLVEGHLKGVSIGGIWYYEDDGRGIHTADLYEISLVAVPMNPDALVRTRSLGAADCQKAFSKFWRSKKSLRTE